MPSLSLSEPHDGYPEAHKAAIEELLADPETKCASSSYQPDPQFGPISWRTLCVGTSGLVLYRSVAI